MENVAQRLGGFGKTQEAGADGWARTANAPHVGDATNVQGQRAYQHLAAVTAALTSRSYRTDNDMFHLDRRRAPYDSCAVLAGCI